MAEPRAALAPEAKTKGGTFSHVRRFVIERFGAEGWDAVLGHLVERDRVELAAVVAVAWHPLGLYARLINALEEVHGYGDFALVVQLGRYEVERDLKTIHRMFLRLANPAYAVEKIGEYWSRHHDTGRWQVSRESETDVSGYLDGWGCVDQALCRELVGYIGRLLELVGADNVVFEHPRCRALGDDRCYFRARWGDSVGCDSGPVRSRRAPLSKPPSGGVAG